jgi:orotate phosphoribosyltransferase
VVAAAGIRTGIAHFKIIGFSGFQFFNGKRVVLFDDVITRGFSYARFACELESFGAEVVGGYFLGRTLFR